MAEALAIGASIIALIQVADRVIKLCKFFISAVRDAPQDLRAILIEILLIKTVFKSLRFLADAGVDNLSVTLCGLVGPNSVVGACIRAVQDLESLFPSHYIESPKDPTGEAKRRKRDFSQALNVLAWPLKVNRARKLLEEIGRHKATITLALTAESREDMKDVKQALTDAQRGRVYEWLEQTNPSTLHNKACDLREENTALWILQTKEWQDWCAGSSRCLWIHGIPGAGKTVLASSIIQNLPSTSAKQNHTKGCIAGAYYYCYFGHNQDETLPFLRWIVSILCRKTGSIPAGILSRFDDGRQDPSSSQLLDGLAETLSSFEYVYIVVDAVDESKEPRTTFLQVLKALATEPRFEKVRLLATSREYFDIKTVLVTCSVPLPMPVEGVNSDIRTYVHSMLGSRRRLVKWPPELRQEVEHTISTRANGMFRWAMCQLDIVERLTSIDAVRSALQDLPKTLDETYERIFDLITPSEQDIVQRTLGILCGHPHGWNVPPGILCGIVFKSWDPKETAYTLCDWDSLQDICGCLITADSGIVSLAHFTVKEFVYSERTWNNMNNRVRYFRLNNEIAAITFILSAIPCALAIKHPSSEIPIHGARLGDYCIYHGFYALSKWRNSLGIGKLEHLLHSFLDPQAQHFERLKLTFTPEMNVVRDDINGLFKQCAGRW